MRAAFIALFATCVLSTVAAAADLEIVRVWKGYRAAESFDRIADYFGAKPDNTIVLRSQPAERDGYYFLVRTKNGGSDVIGARAELRVITPFSPEAKTFAYSCVIAAGKQVMHLGLTGTDWPAGADSDVVAWQVRLLDPSGAELAKEQSFLWEKPAQK